MVIWVVPFNWSLVDIQFHLNSSPRYSFFTRLIGQKILRIAFKDDLAVVDDIGPVGNFQNFPDIVIGDDDPQFFLAEGLDDLPQFRDLNRIDPGKRFVQQQEIG